MTRDEIFDAFKNGTLVEDRFGVCFTIIRMKLYSDGDFEVYKSDLKSFCVSTEYAKKLKRAKIKKKYWLWTFKSIRTLLQTTTIYLDGDMKDSDGLPCLAVANAKFKQKIESSVIELEE